MIPYNVPMQSNTAHWRDEWLKNGPRDDEGTTWWVYFERPTERWLAYGLRRGDKDRAIPLEAKTFPDAVREMFEKMGIDQIAYDAEFRWREKQKAELEKKKRLERDAMAMERQSLRKRLGLGLLNGPRLGLAPFANHAIGSFGRSRSCNSRISTS